MLGFGPLLLTPLSETFGRRPIFLTNLGIFTLLQIPTALAPDLPTLIALRSVAGIFGSVGIANGGGTISDLFPAAQRATVLGVYLLGPLVGPSLGPFMGGMINARLHWRWIIWALLGICIVLWTVCYFFLYETYAPMILDERRKMLQKKNPDTQYRVEGASQEPVWRKITGVWVPSLAPSIRPSASKLQLTSLVIELHTCATDPLHATDRPDNVAVPSDHLCLDVHLVLNVHQGLDERAVQLQQAAIGVDVPGADDWLHARRDCK